MQYRCGACAFSSGELAVGWGKAGRNAYWGGLAHCAACRALLVVNLTEAHASKRDPLCPKCRGLLKLVDGLAERVPCPSCGRALDHVALGSWA